MGFDWKSFATGFMETTVETLEQRETEAKEFEREQRDAARRNAATISRRRAVADQVTGYANYLRSNGVSPAQIQAVIASGPRAIEDLTQRVQQAVRANGGRPLGASDVSTLISMPDNFVASDLELSEYIDQTYGLSSGLQLEPPAAQEFSFMDRLFGRDQMTLAEGRVATTPFAEGMTIQQINDQSDSGLEAINTNSGSQATYQVASVNGLNSLRLEIDSEASTYFLSSDINFLVINNYLIKKQ